MKDKITKKYNAQGLLDYLKNVLILPKIWII